MKRDMELIYLILAYAEEHGDLNNRKRCVPNFDEYDPDYIDYHVRLCEEAGYLKASWPSGNRRGHVQRLTWQGHEALDASRTRNE